MNISDLTTSTILLKRLHENRDADAWTIFVRRYRQPLLNFALARGYYDIDVEVAVQETLCAVSEQLPAGGYHADRGHFRNWILGILMNRLKDAIRSEAHRRERESRFAENQVRDTEAMRTAVLWRKICLRHAVRMLLQSETVTGRTRAVFEESVLKHRPVDEVANAYGLTPNAVYQIKSRMISRLRSIMRKLC